MVDGQHRPMADIRSVSLREPLIWLRWKLGGSGFTRPSSEQFFRDVVP
jgi:hypothetical protein